MYICTYVRTYVRMYVHMCVCTSYYMPVREYHIYCSRPEGAKQPRASAVNAILPRDGCVVTSLSPDEKFKQITG